VKTINDRLASQYENDAIEKENRRMKKKLRQLSSQSFAGEMMSLFDE
jgi:hypothetical protein